MYKSGKLGSPTGGFGYGTGFGPGMFGPLVVINLSDIQIR